ncbi:Cupredoxin-like domain-containing protein [Robiginitalea myxolifaciens]|uniref:Cupredoxin-like domain-containing protein n=1 Tax=Robiginitalea myxolifaciens TaxID=400055 RepID=A0A1I6FN69_9FLAO|nr:cupredoxin domain-containing protein [Robiginitalea myxolifaciens]SFR31314.1 Cupredoxin-like domain-containing protein [Robiginitalea myxolifaciens]
MKNILKSLVVFGALLIAQTGLAQDKMAMNSSMEKAAKIVKLTQTEGEFTTKTLNLEAGNYIFEISNQGVDHELGFVLAPKGKTDQAHHIKAAYVKKTVNDGESSQTNIVTLEKGEYVYFCPLNPTPHYTLIVD